MKMSLMNPCFRLTALYRRHQDPNFLSPLSPQPFISLADLAGVKGGEGGGVADDVRPPSVRSPFINPFLPD